MENVSWLRSKSLANARVSRWRSQPVSALAVWLTGVLVVAGFPVASYLLGRPYQGDSFETLPTAWALAHGRWACAYPASMWLSPHQGISAGLAAPLFSVLMAGVFVALRATSLHPFPAPSSMGPHCTHAISVIETWMTRSHVMTLSLWIGLLGWLALVGAVVIFLTRRGRRMTRGDAVVFVIATCCTPVFWAYGFNFHPQDLLAIALVVLAITFFSQQRWVGAGVLLGLGLMTQQFVALAAVPLIILAWRLGHRSFIVATVSAVATVAAPLMWLTSGAAWRSILIGSSRLAPLSTARVHSAGGTWLAGLHLNSATVFVVARLVPLLSAIVLSYAYIRRSRGDSLVRTGPLAAMVGSCLALRLLFEQNLFPYYFAPLAVLLLLAATSMRLRTDLVVFWFLFATIGYSPLLDSFIRSPLLVTRAEITLSTWGLIGVMIVIVIANVVRGRLRLYQPVAVVTALLIFHAPLRGLGVQASTWEMQFLLVSLGLYILASALLTDAAPTEVTTPPPATA